nr:uncharacterized protein LOC120095612 isoform X2 [Rattus norvegicus]
MYLVAVNHFPILFRSTDFEVEEGGSQVQAQTGHLGGGSRCSSMILVQYSELSKKRQTHFTLSKVQQGNGTVSANKKNVDFHAGDWQGTSERGGASCKELWEAGDEWPHRFHREGLRAGSWWPKAAVWPGRKATGQAPVSRYPLVSWLPAPPRMRQLLPLLLPGGQSQAPPKPVTCSHGVLPSAS